VLMLIQTEFRATSILQRLCYTHVQMLGLLKQYFNQQASATSSASGSAKDGPAPIKSALKKPNGASKDSSHVPSSALPESSAPLVSGDVVRHVVETVAYLTLHAETKRLLVKQNGVGLDLILRLCKDPAASDRAVRFGLTQIIANCCTSSEDMKRGFNQVCDEVHVNTGVDACVVVGI